MDHAGRSTVFTIDGHEILATFVEHRNETAIGQVKQILLSSFVANNKKAPFKDILAIQPEQRDNSSRNSPGAA